ncbi:unnamed protein product [Lactuca saligna]|uniref:Transmembrane protein n=1 Tax=Lactuca saligna TaxID=75948 RepID=A0AA36E0T5_LACSI|nr:unnamed protein product [Lactuca saligna]
MAEETETPTITTASGSEKHINPSSNSSQSDPKQLPPYPFYGFTAPNGEHPMYPIMYPMLIPPQQGQDQMDHGAGIYAVPTFPNSFMGPVAGIPTNTLIPFTYNIPTGQSPTEGGTGGEEVGQAGQVGQQQQGAGQQRQVVVRRFQIAIHLDLMLILKLAAVIFLFNQDGSRKRLVLLIFFASLIYLYQTGALAPLIRWLSQGMQRAGAPPQQGRAGVRAADLIPPAARQEHENPLLPDGQVGGENENQNREGDGNEEGEVDNGNNNRWWGVVKEIQLIVFGFITSLLPGFHNID